ncbi:MAG: N-acetylmuramoyl-L-alanine amidase [Conexibacter sp.]
MRIPLVATTVAVLLAAVPAACVAAGPPSSFAVAVPAGADASAGWRTPELRPARPFELVGAQWRGAGAQVELRARRTDGRWSRWARVVAGEPVWSGRAVAVQLRGAAPVRDLRVRAVALGRASGPAPGARAAARSVAGGPPIVPRSAWDPHDRCRPRVPARYGRVDFAVVHHTETLSAYSRAQSAAIVLGICLFHRDGNRWNDIGYDLLVDRYGTVFEGRAGGVDQPVLGAQSGGWNAVSTGVAMIGSYTSASPPAVALRALERALAWKLSLAGVPAQGSVVERSSGGERGVNRYRRGALVRFARIAGHRDADFTSCPGGALYALLPQIRRAVAALLPAPRDELTLAPVGAPIEQAPWLLTGRLALGNGRRPAGVDVRVEQQGADGVWRAVAAARTGADGIWSATPTLLVNGPLRAVATLPGGRELAAPTVPAQVRTGIAVRVSRRVVRPGGELELTGATSPAKARVRVLVERRRAGNRFERVLAWTITTDDGGFARTLRLSAPGAYRLRAATAADQTNAAGASRPVAVRVLATARRPHSPTTGVMTTTSRVRRPAATG